MLGARILACYEILFSLDNIMLDVRYLPEGVASVVCNKLGRMMRNGTLTVFILINITRQTESAFSASLSVVESYLSSFLSTHARYSSIIGGRV